MTDVGAWQERLAATFGHDGVIGQELSRLDEAEAAYGAWVADTFRGFMAISEAFLVFHLETPELINRHIALPLNEAKGRAPAAHAICTIRHATDFRTLRASRHLLFTGAPLQGAMLMRPVFDGAVIRSAIMQELTTVEASEGVPVQKSGQEIDPDVVRKARIKEEKRIDSIMVGSESGLSEDTKNALSVWEGLLHAEIHGAKLSLASALKWLKGEAPLPFLPHPDNQAAAMLMNRWCEVAWMVHRLMPTLQLEKYRFPKEWREKWTVLDESFAPMVQALSKELGKKIGDAMAEFVNAKFPFNGDSFCPG